MRHVVLIVSLAMPAVVLAQSVPAPDLEVPAPPGPGLDLSVSGAQLLEKDLGGGKDVGSECQAMLQQLDAMKNQPLRRNALWERYQAQCQSGMDGMPPYVPPMPQ